MVAQAFDASRMFKPGDVFQQYVVLGFLAAGRSGEVYAVEHRFTGDRFALKVCRLVERKDTKKMARALVEAQATYRLEHRNIVHVFDLGCENDGLLVWQRMELLDGMALGDIIDRYGKLSPLYAIEIALRVAWGLQAAHEQQIIHRDIHPWNVFVTTGGKVKVLDFSHAKVTWSGIETTCGTRVGTAGYMAPEALRGARAVPPTPQFDVFSLGTLFWQMLTGRRPYASCDGNVMLVVTKQLVEGLGPTGLPACCDDVIGRATARDPAERYDGMWSFSQALLALQEQLAADPAAVQEVWSPPEWERRRPIEPDSVRQPEYRAPRALPRESPVPHVPSKRIVVSPAVGGWRPVAATVPMQAVDAPPPSIASRRPAEIAPPTVRARPPSQPRRLWIVLSAAWMLCGLGVAAWAAIPGDASGASAAPTPSAAAPRAPVSAAPVAAAPASASPSPADARRPSSSRPKH
jgi:serine/threonine-protein kinase